MARNGARDKNGAHDKIRLLYVARDTQSREAEQALQTWRVTYVKFPVSSRRRDTRDEPKPPCLITEEGRFSGVQSIRKYAERFGSR